MNPAQIWRRFPLVDASHPPVVARRGTGHCTWSSSCTGSPLAVVVVVVEKESILLLFFAFRRLYGRLLLPGLLLGFPQLTPLPTPPRPRPPESTFSLVDLMARSMSPTLVISAPVTIEFVFFETDFFCAQTDHTTREFVVCTAPLPRAASRGGGGLVEGVDEFHEELEESKEGEVVRGR